MHPSEAEDEDEETDDEDDDAEEASAEKGRKPTLLERTGSVSACDSGILFSRSQPRLCYVCFFWRRFVTGGGEVSCSPGAASGSPGGKASSRRCFVTAGGGVSGSPGAAFETPGGNAFSGDGSDGLERRSLVSKMCLVSCTSVRASACCPFFRDACRAALGLSHTHTQCLSCDAEPLRNSMCTNVFAG